MVFHLFVFDVLYLLEYFGFNFLIDGGCQYFFELGILGGDFVPAEGIVVFMGELQQFIEEGAVVAYDDHIDSI